MFKAKTVFIVGAGASKEVNLPVGEGLKNMIAQCLHCESSEYGYINISDDRISRAIQQNNNEKRKGNIAGISHSDLKPCKDLIKGLPLSISIDNFLDAHQGDTEVEFFGKLGIVHSILHAERNSKLFIDTSKYAYTKMNFHELSGTWFMGFFRVLTENVKKGEDLEGIFENISIITFNYDRCIEHFLYHALQAYYRISPNDAASLIKKLTILHPYGQVGQLPWQSHNESHPNYGDENNNLSELSKQIKTFTESLEDQESSEIKDLVENAEIIVFLGFAYHRQNLELLQPRNPSKVKYVLGTAFEVSNSDRKVTENELISILNRIDNPPKIELGRSDLTCGQLFKEYSKSISPQNALENSPRR